MDISAFQHYQSIRERELSGDQKETEKDTNDRRYGIKVIAIAAGITGLLILMLGIFTNKGKAYIIIAGLLVIIFSFLIISRTRQQFNINRRR